MGARLPPAKLSRKRGGFVRHQTCLVRRNEIGPIYWTTCRVTACEPGREFGFEVLLGDRAVNIGHRVVYLAGSSAD